MHFTITPQKITPKMLLSLCIALIVTYASATDLKHHKVRHKHNLLSFRDNHVNEIREAFAEYRNSLPLHKKNRNFESDEYDDNIDNNLNSSEKIFKKLLSPNTEKPRKSTASSVQFFARKKRVFTTKSTTTTQRSTDDDDEYFDSENDTASRRQVRINRDSSYNENQLAEGESFTDYKWKTLGTPDGVGNSFQQAQLRENKDKGYHVNRHLEHLRIHGMCRWPSKKIISMPRTPSKRYYPLSYLVYQCSDDTACCTSPEKTCVAKKFEEIELWFHVQHMPSTRDSFESIKVINHTECDCVYKNQAVQRTTRVPPFPHWPLPTSTKPPMCKCPSFFTSEVDEDDVCACVCKTKIECIQRHEGNEGFTLSDRRCIQTGECVQPSCQHGTYLGPHGRCPDKNEKINKGFQAPRTRRR